MTTARVVDKRERQINLVLVLLHTTSPLPLSRLRADVPGYDGGAAVSYTHLTLPTIYSV